LALAVLGLPAAKSLAKMASRAALVPIMRRVVAAEGMETIQKLGTPEAQAAADALDQQEAAERPIKATQADHPPAPALKVRVVAVVQTQ